MPKIESYLNPFGLSLLIVFTVFAISCGRSGKSRLNIDTHNLHPEKVQIKQYGKALFEADTANLQAELKRLKPDFIHFLDADLADSSNIMQIYDFVSDTNLILLNNKSRAVYSDLYLLENDFTHAFRRFHYHFPSIAIPEIYTYISGVQYEMPILIADDISVIAIDCYLGSDFEHYSKLGIPRYITTRMTPEHMVNDLFKTLYEVLIDESASAQNILDEMIKAGKRLYFQEAMQPTLADHLIIGYTPDQYRWATSNEAQLWAHLVGEELLYSNDFQSFRSLFSDGPFSGDFSREAPARLGEWVGWQIVRQYMQQHPEQSLGELVRLNDSQEILSGSRYRPK
jgi:hypothetical protein